MSASTAAIRAHSRALPAPFPGAAPLSCTWTTEEEPPAPSARLAPAPHRPSLSSPTPRLRPGTENSPAPAPLVFWEPIVQFCLGPACFPFSPAHVGRMPASWQCCSPVPRSTQLPVRQGEGCVPSLGSDIFCGWRGHLLARCYRERVNRERCFVYATSVAEVTPGGRGTADVQLLGACSIRRRRLPVLHPPARPRGA